MKYIEWFIYSLSDPRNGAVRYVGRTTDPRRRLTQHLSRNDYPSRHKQAWIRLLRGVRLAPVLNILEAGSGDWAEAERRWIQKMRALGFDLINKTDGGDGVPGIVPSAETRERMSAAAKARAATPEGKQHHSALGRLPKAPHTAESIARAGEARRGKAIHSPEVRAKMSAERRGKKLGAEWSANISHALKGITRSPETRAKMSAAAKARSPETRAKMSAAQKVVARRRVATPEGREQLEALWRSHKKGPHVIAKTARANRGRKGSPENRANISHALTGITRSPETRAKMSAAKRSTSPETRAKMSAAAKARSPETRAKMSAAQKVVARRRVATPEGREQLEALWRSHKKGPHV